MARAEDSTIEDVVAKGLDVSSVGSTQVYSGATGKDVR